MTIPEAINLFEHEMLNEIFHLVTDENLRDTLVASVKNVSSTLAETYNAEQK